MCKKIELFGVRFDNYDKEELERVLTIAISGSERGYLVTPNPYIIEKSVKDENLRDALSGASFSIVDGVGILFASRFLKKELKCRIPGVEIGELVLSLCSKMGNGVYFLGGEDGIAEAAASAMRGKYIGLQTAGYSHGFFTDEENESILRKINESGAKVLFVCLGSPRQEKWIAENIKKLDSLRLALCLGGSLDVYSGKVRRAPLWIRKCGIEWLWRSFTSIRHFKRLYHIPVFLYHVVLEGLKK